MLEVCGFYVDFHQKSVKIRINPGIFSVFGTNSKPCISKDRAPRQEVVYLEALLPACCTER